MSPVLSNAAWGISGFVLISFNFFCPNFHIVLLKEYYDKEGLPGGSEVKVSAWNAGDLGLIPGLGRRPGEGKGCPLQCSGLENPMDCIDHAVTKRRPRLGGSHSFHAVVYNFNGKQVSFCSSCAIVSFWRHPSRASSGKFPFFFPLEEHISSSFRPVVFNLAAVGMRGLCGQDAVSPVGSSVSLCGSYSIQLLPAGLHAFY